MFNPLVSFIRDLYKSNDFIPLHAPKFAGKEKEYVLNTIDSTFVSSVGGYVNQFEDAVKAYTGTDSAVAMVNGTSALHLALKLAGVKSEDLVITQPLTFIATCNAIHYCGAEPVFIDVDRSTLGLSPQAVDEWLSENAFLDDNDQCRTQVEQRIIRAVLPMHTFGHPVDLAALHDVADRWSLQLVEDAAESLGSRYQGKHTGTFGLLGVLSFNGNKIITTGGGGMILTSSELGKHAKHLSTTAKIHHDYDYIHDEIGYNYRMPNLNAALGCAQVEQIEAFVDSKRAIAASYEDWFQGSSLQFVVEPENCRSNYWLNAVICEDKAQRDSLLNSTNEQGVMTRPIWRLMNHLPIYSACRKGELQNAEWLEHRVVNLPSSVCITN